MFWAIDEHIGNVSKVCWPPPLLEAHTCTEPPHSSARASRRIAGINTTAQWQLAQVLLWPFLAATCSAHLQATISLPRSSRSSHRYCTTLTWPCIAAIRSGSSGSSHRYRTTLRWPLIGNTAEHGHVTPHHSRHSGGQPSARAMAVAQSMGMEHGNVAPPAPWRPAAKVVLLCRKSNETGRGQKQKRPINWKKDAVV